MSAYVTQFTGNGSQTAFTATFPVLRLTDLAVVVDNAWLTLGTQYLVSGSLAGATATLVAAPANGAVVTLRSAVGYTPTDPAAVTTAAPTLSQTDTALWAAIADIDAEVSNLTAAVSEFIAPTLALDAPLDRRGPLLSDPPGTVEHVYFDGTGLVSKWPGRYTWSKVGNPAVQDSAYAFPSGFASAPRKAAICDASNYWATGTGAANPFNSANLWVIFVGKYAGGSTHPITNAAALQGFQFAVDAVVQNYVVDPGGGASHPYGVGGASLNGQMNVICFGMSGTDFVSRVNNNAANHKVMDHVFTACTAAAQIGGGDANPWTGELLEIIIGHTAATDATFATAWEELNGLSSVVLQEYGSGLGSARASGLAMLPTGVPYGTLAANLGWDKVIESRGVRVDPTVTGYFDNPQNPATQTITLPTGTFSAWVVGSGSLVVSAGTATVTGLPQTVVDGGDGSWVNFVVTVGGTVVCTVSGSPSQVCVVGSAWRTHNIGPWGTYGKAGQCYSQLLRVRSQGMNSAQGQLSFTFSPIWSASGAGATQTILTDAAIANNSSTAGILLQYIAASRVFRLTVGGVTVDSAVQSFSRLDTLAISLTYRTGGDATLTVNGITSTGSSTVTSFTPGFMLTFGGCGGWVKGISITQTNLPGSVALGICTLGDSLTYGYGNGFKPVSASLSTLLGSGYSIDNYGIPGDRMDATPNPAAEVPGRSGWRYLSRVHGRGYYAVVPLLGINDVSWDSTAAQMWAHLKGIYDAVLASGARLVPVTVAPWNGAGSYTAGRETQRTTLNTSIRAYAAANSLAYVDLSTDFDNGSGALKPAYDGGDHLHWTDAASDRYAALVKTALGL
jgi:hypothetical protein